jgi:hypothetical protein
MPWHTTACQNESMPHKIFFGVSQVSNPGFSPGPWWMPWHAKRSRRRTNFCFAHAICPKCVYNLIITHLEGVPSFKSKVRSGALVDAMACLGVCHGMPKRVDTAQNFFWPMPFAQSVFLSSLLDIWKVSRASNARFASGPWWVPWHTMTCLGVCHGMPINATQIFVMPMPFAQSVFII